MKVDMAHIPGHGELMVKTGAGTFTSSLKEGDSINAEVLSNDKSTVTMKTDDGQIFKAKLDSGVMLSEGDAVLLEVTGKQTHVVSLAIRNEDAESRKAEEQLKLVQGFNDKTLLPYASKLAELSMPVSEETAYIMREVIAVNPEMTLDEAAFIAANKLAGDESIMMAALALLSDGDKADEMLERLISLVLQSSGASINEPVQEQLIGNPVVLPDRLSAGNGVTSQIMDGAIGHVPDSPSFIQSFPEPSALISGEAVNSGQQIINSKTTEASLTEWFRLIEKGDTNSAAEYLRGIPLPMPATEEIIPHGNSIMQSIISENSVEKLNYLTSTGNTQATEPQNLQTQQADEKNNYFRNTEEKWVDASSGAQAIRLPETKSGEEQFRATGAEIAGMLSRLEEFRGTPPSALERFSNMLLRVAGDNVKTASGDMEKLIGILEKMFTRIEKNDSDAGVQLKRAKEELYARLTLLGESISRSQSPAKAEMLEQTRKLAEHVRMLNNVDQFAYLQIPVQMGDQRKTAELYLFKKKNSKRIDPENVNILLTLDLENLGHWEGLINFRSKDVSVKMEVAGPKEKEHFSENTVLLHELLGEAGFRLVSTDITHSEKETTPLTALSVLSRLVNSRSGGIDFTI